MSVDISGAASGTSVLEKIFGAFVSVGLEIELERWLPFVDCLKSVEAATIIQKANACYSLDTHASADSLVIKTVQYQF